MTLFVWLGIKIYSYSTDDDSHVKKAKITETGVIKRKLKFENYKTCLEATQLENKIHHLQKNEIDVVG